MENAQSLNEFLKNCWTKDELKAYEKSLEYYKFREDILRIERRNIKCH